MAKVPRAFRPMRLPVTFVLMALAVFTPAPLPEMTLPSTKA